MSTTKTRRSLSLLAAFAVAAGALALPAATSATQAAPAFGLAATVERAPSAGGGLATFSGLPLGAYVVTETVTPAGYVGSKPFIITVPMTHPTDLNKWVYDVHAYPKNSKAGIEKTVKDDTTPAIGSAISYTIKSDIPAAEALDFYDVVDQYDKRVELPEADIALKIING